MSCYFEFSEKCFDCSSSVIYDTVLTDLVERVNFKILSKYKLFDLTPEILHDLQDMLKDFDAKNGSYKFNLHFGMVLCFDLMLHNVWCLPKGGFRITNVKLSTDVQ